MTMKWLAALACAALGGGVAHADVLYRYNQAVIFDGRYGSIAAFQDAANTALAACGKEGLAADGKFGGGTRAALARLAACPAIAPALAADADARAGAITTAYWSALGLGQAPTVDARARSLMLTYEATDYTRMEWNFCQSSPLYDPPAGRTVCYSNDPRSYLTWGPNGATGGGGREVQLILAAVDKASPALIDESFGAEAAAVRRTFVLRDRDTDRTLETYLCGVWASPDRRAAWKAGFAAIGKSPLTRTTFDNLYRSRSLDGGKIATFVRAYADNGLTPTEVDYAFFKDRSAHTTPSYTAIRDAIAGQLAAEAGSPRWKIRQAIALKVRPSSQRQDRLGRDVAFYIDGASALSVEERTAWAARGRLRASDAGLSDARFYTGFSPGEAIDTGIASPSALTPAERAACPQAVLDTRRP